jgi:hypothetical protein
MIKPADTIGLARPALSLGTASLATAVRLGALSRSEMRDIIVDAHALVHDCTGFVVDAETEEAAENFLLRAEALAELLIDRRSDRELPLQIRPEAPT